MHNREKEPSSHQKWSLKVVEMVFVAAALVSGVSTGTELPRFGP